MEVLLAGGCLIGTGKPPGTSYGQLVEPCTPLVRSGGSVFARLARKIAYASCV